MHDSPKPLLSAVRITRGLTQIELARLSGVSQGLISALETARDPLTDVMATTLGEALGAPPELISAVAPTPDVRQALQASLPAQTVRRFLASLSLAHFHVGRILKTQPSRLPIREYDGPPEDHAYLLRASWDIPVGPIRSMIQTLEDHGVICLVRDTSPLRTDVIGSWTPGEHPILLIGTHFPARKMRFALARELGRAIMADSLSPTPDADAKAFATSFLLPDGDLPWPTTRTLTLTHFTDLEQESGVPAAVLLDLALKTRAITGVQQKAMKKTLHSNEDRDAAVRRERPQALHRAVLQRVTGGESHQHVASDALLDRTALSRDYLAGSG